MFLLLFFKLPTQYTWILNVEIDVSRPSWPGQFFSSAFKNAGKMLWSESTTKSIKYNLCNCQYETIAEFNAQLVSHMFMN